MVIRDKDSALFLGCVTLDPTFKEFESGKNLCEFAIKYDYIPPATRGGKGENKYIYVKAWNADSRPLLTTAKYLTKGDYLWVAGRVERDEYRSEKKGADVFYLTAEAVIPAEVVTTVTQLILSGKVAEILTGGAELEEVTEEEELPEEFKD